MMALRTGPMHETGALHQLRYGLISRRAVVTSAVLLLITACADSEPPPPAPDSRPVKLFVVDEGLGQEIRQFPATIEAAKQAELAFRVSGQLADLPIREGDVVEDGQVVASLDATDFELSVEDRQAAFDNAQSNFSRAEELVRTGAISRSDYDRMEAEFRSSRAALSQAKANLGYATLRAPFTGRIARRYVDNFEEIRAKQAIVYLHDVDMLDVIIALPESVVRSVSAADAPIDNTTDLNQEANADVRAMASFEDYSSTSFALEVKEIGTRADPDTQTFPVTFSMPQPDEFSVLPGMTAQVELDFTGLIVKDRITWIPARAVQGDADLQPRVFVLDAQQMVVRSRPVTTGRMSGDRIEILDGLQGGEEIVEAGSAYLADGMRVTRMRTGEQAIPRESDELGSADA
ncbi:MAG: efflux RND transporter periplasmic adaptor subunit [Pseudomonadota bacterium]